MTLLNYKVFLLKKINLNLRKKLQGGETENTFKHNKLCKNRPHKYIANRVFLLIFKKIIIMNS